METRKRRRICPQTNPPISKLGDDVLLEILIRLPNPRYACRCKSVCKRWRSLISSPSFNRSFASHYENMVIMKKLPPPPPIPTDDPLGWKPSILMTFLPDLSPHHLSLLSVLDCFKDLLLCGFVDVDMEMVDDEIFRTFLVCNPFTKQWLVLPLAPHKPKGCRWSVSRLVCEPRISYDLDLGLEGGDDDQNPFVVYSEYRFRVVCMYQDTRSIKLDIFCSDIGEWKKQALILDGYRILEDKNVCTCDGELFWSCVEDADWYQRSRNGSKPLLAWLNAFHLDSPIDIHSCPLFDTTKNWDLAVSQGALHLILRETQTETVSVWRREEDGRSWTIQCEGSLQAAASSSVSYKDVKYYSILNMHPEKPEVIYFEYLPPCFSDCASLSCNLRRGDLEYVSYTSRAIPRWTLYQPRVSYWPTPIPRYEELQGMYDGSMSEFRVASNNNSLIRTARLKKCRKSRRKTDSRVRLIPQLANRIPTC